MSPKLLFLPRPKKKIVKKHLPFLLPGFLGFLIILTCWQKVDFFLERGAQFKASLWPQLSVSHFAFSGDLFQKGQRDLSQKEFKIGEKQVEVLNKIYLGFLFRGDLLETEKIIHREEDIRKELKILEKQLEETPYSWQLLLEKAVLAYQVYEDGLAKEAWDLAYWLDPNNEEVLKLEEKLGFLSLESNDSNH